MASDCSTIIDNIDTQVQGDINNFKNEIFSAVSSLIGYSSNSGIRNAKLRLVAAITRKEKKIATKQLRQEEAKYAGHLELFFTNI